MNGRRNQDLEKELEQSGATQDEARTLANYAQSLRQLKDSEPKLRPLNVGTLHSHKLRPGRTRMLATGLTVIGTLVAGIAIAAVAQTSIPGNFLYPVKRVTENVAVTLQPNYRGVLMMRRAQEVAQLVALHKNPGLVNETLQSYKTDVADYKGNNYADFEYCENSLAQAQSMSQGSERLAIATTLADVKGQTE
ncbi:MAG TPA: hypothetical protein VMS08_03330 [Candidatus Saccharimonadia bacterium]|nr:hypothetical protein [Candidatus Saccharimonadia bacterium]